MGQHAGGGEPNPYAAHIDDIHSMDHHGFRSRSIATNGVIPGATCVRQPLLMDALDGLTWMDALGKEMVM
jgi:hypothetical protein